MAKETRQYDGTAAFARVSPQSRLSGEEGDNEMIPGVGDKSPGVYLMVNEKPTKSQIREHLKAVRPL